MPSHQERREPLPKGYQFGDAGAFRHQWWCGGLSPCACSPGWLAGGWRDFVRPTAWRPRHENAADEIARKADWNVIEGDH